jgi:hypothetical protein
MNIFKNSKVFEWESKLSQIENTIAATIAGTRSYLTKAIPVLCLPRIK